MRQVISEAIFFFMIIIIIWLNKVQQMENTLSD